ncbi:hypothetical protein A2U01_0101543, partial [Trifolium medium]|nr:hypothetical protein [Trifolium medium]
MVPTSSKWNDLVKNGKFGDGWEMAKRAHGQEKK